MHTYVQLLIWKKVGAGGTACYTLAFEYLWSLLAHRRP
jgi:hypothetical protein